MNQCRSWQAAGKTIVFTNGCFDLLHRGHVEYLEAARNLGDFLVVGLNSDASVTRLKGPGRPLVPEGDRAVVLNALKFVDMVVIFHEDTPKELIRDLHPAILVKGGDWKKADLAGGDLVESWGGRIELIPFRAGYSTTSIIAKIRRLGH